jgi:hypothetical protein
MAKTNTKTKKISWEASAEQQLVCDHICLGENVVVDACAGSGKSTTILTVANALPKKRFLQITYNAMLRKEFKEKVAECGLDNIEVHTYHSFAVKYFFRDAHTDTGIRHLLYSYSKSSNSSGDPHLGVTDRVRSEEAFSPLPDEVTDDLVTYPEIPAFDIVVLDETQDMTLLYYRLVTYILHVICNKNYIKVILGSDVSEVSSVEATRNGCPLTNISEKRGRGRPHKLQLLILGDYMQGLYEFKGADTRFLTLASQIWASCKHLKSPIFRSCTLRTSYRITRPMASFVNHAMLGHTTTENIRLCACRDGSPVVYIRHSRTNIECIVVNLILRLLEGGDLPSDIFVLGGSVKGVNSNIRKMENVLVERNIPCHVPMLETDKIDDRVINGKVVFSTFHSVKGRQRKYVFIVGFDQSYFTYYGREMDELCCPNTLYVGCTRATHVLYLLENNDWSTDRPLTFLKMNHHEMKSQDYIDFRGTPQSIFYEKDPTYNAKKEKIHYVTPTELIKFIPEHVLEKITPMLDHIFASCTVDLPELSPDHIPSVVQFANGLYEDVADLNGIAIPCLYWDQLQPEPTNVLYQLIGNMIRDLKDKDHSFIKKVYLEIDPLSQTPSDYLYLANIYIAVQEKLYFKLKQIDRSEYQWLSQEAVDICKQRMDTIVGCEKVEQHEHVFVHPKMEDAHCRIDMLLQPELGTDVKYRFTARLDIITQESIWELKCTQQITIDHLLQVVIYAWLWRTINPESTKKVKIFNIKNGEVMELRATIDELTEIMIELLRGKYEKAERLNDQQFLKQFTPLQ